MIKHFIDSTMTSYTIQHYFQSYKFCFEVMRFGEVAKLQRNEVALFNHENYSFDVNGYLHHTCEWSNSIKMSK